MHVGFRLTVRPFLRWFRRNGPQPCIECWRKAQQLQNPLLERAQSRHRSHDPLGPVDDSSGSCPHTLRAEARPSGGPLRVWECQQTVPPVSSPPLPIAGGRHMPTASTPARQSILTGCARWHGRLAAQTSACGRAAALEGAPHAAPPAMQCDRPARRAPVTTTRPVAASHTRATPRGVPLPPTPLRPPSPRRAHAEHGRPAPAAPGRPAPDAACPPGASATLGGAPRRRAAQAPPPPAGRPTRSHSACARARAGGGLHAARSLGPPGRAAPPQPRAPVVLRAPPSAAPSRPAPARRPAGASPPGSASPSALPSSAPWGPSRLTALRTGAPRQTASRAASTAPAARGTCGHGHKEPSPRATSRARVARDAIVQSPPDHSP